MTHGKTSTHLDVNFVTTRRASRNLIKQFDDLCRSGLNCKSNLKPVSQQIRLTGTAHALQLLDDQPRAVRDASAYQINFSKLVQQLLRLRGMCG